MPSSVLVQSGIACVTIVPRHGYDWSVHSSEVHDAVVRPNDPLAAEAVARVRALSKTERSVLTETGVLHLAIAGSECLMRRWPEVNTLEQCGRLLRTGTLRDPARRTFAVLRRAEVAGLGAPRPLLAGAIHGVGCLLVEHHERPSIPLDPDKHRSVAGNFGRALAALHAHGFVSSSVSRTDFGVLEGVHPEAIPLGFCTMQWGKIVPLQRRIMHLAACAEAFEGDPFGFIQGEATDAYLQASCLRDPRERVVDAIRKVYRRSGS